MLYIIGEVINILEKRKLAFTSDVSGFSGKTLGKVGSGTSDLSRLVGNQVGTHESDESDDSDDSDDDDADDDDGRDDVVDRGSDSVKAGAKTQQRLKDEEKENKSIEKRKDEKKTKEMR